MDTMNDDTLAEQTRKKNLKCAASAASAASAAIIAVGVAIDSMTRQPYRGEGLRGLAETERIIGVSDFTCRAQIRMTRNAFFNLCALVKERGLLTDSKHVSMEEQLCIFLHTIGHNAKNRQLVNLFGRSGHTISQYFNLALNAIVKLYNVLLPLPSTRTPPKIRDHPRRYFPYFKDCIGAIDGSHVPAWVSIKDHQRFWDRKGNISQNILVACDFDMNFTYVLAGWEGSASDFRILEDTLRRGGEAKLVVHPAKYYLVDAGFANQTGFLRPYRNVRYHLKEWRNSNQSPTDKKELFNMRHSHLRNVIERVFGLLKSRFKILKNQPEYAFNTQVKLVTACILMHNYILRHGRMDDDEGFFASEEDTTRQRRVRVAIPEVESEEDDDDDSDNDAEVDANMNWDQYREELATQMWNDWVGNAEENDD